MRYESFEVIQYREGNDKQKMQEVDKVVGHDNWGWNESISH